MRYAYMNPSSWRPWLLVIGLGGALGLGKLVGTMYERPKETQEKTAVQEEKPTLSHTIGSMVLDFYDRDLDGKTVERYRKTVFGDYGTTVAGKVVADLERDSMTKLQRDLVDSLYEEAQEAKKGK